jgi:energy-coupling factor transporter ATP-binding protein EcfA2
MSSYHCCSPLDFAGFIDTVVSTTYELFNRKIFSLPKIVLLPVVMGRQPKMIAQLFPIIFATDWMKGRVVSYMTNKMEQLEKDVQELNAIRAKVEQFDMKHAELLQRAGPGATNFTRRRWEDLTVRIQMKKVVSELMARTKGFFAFLQRNFLFSVLVDCALAQLIAVGKLMSADIFVISRAIEDAVDMVLMRSRSEAELARMMTQIDNLKELAQVWQSAEDRNVLPCNIAPPGVKDHISGSHPSLVVLRNLLYSRGTASVRIDHLELPAGVYALTGANGSGKSTLFRVLMSCNTNDRPIDLPPSIVLSTPMAPLIEEDDIQREVSCEAADESIESSLLPSDDTDTSDGRELTELSNTVTEMEISGDGATMATKSASTGSEYGKAKVIEEIAHPRLSITMPSSHVAEISQTFYWPLYSKPIEWIYQHHLSETLSVQELEERTRRVAELLHSLEFTQSLEPEGVLPIDSNAEFSASKELQDESAKDAIVGIMEQLMEEKEDWFGDLSGGQKSKVELVRKVFLLDECPRVLLIDETMAPLDPRSKSLVMAQLKAFCSNSVVIVIYHTDVGRESEDEGGDLVECVPSNDFFDGNIHVDNKIMNLRPVC